MSVPQAQQDVQLPNHRDATTAYAASVVGGYQPHLTTSGDTIPNIAEAEDVINKVILFVHSQTLKTVKIVWVAATSDEVHSTQGLLEAQDDSQRLGN